MAEQALSGVAMLFGQMDSVSCAVQQALKVLSDDVASRMASMAAELDGMQKPEPAPEGPPPQGGGAAPQAAPPPMEMDYSSLAVGDRDAIFAACASAGGGDGAAIAKSAFEAAAAVLERAANRRNAERRG